MTGIVVAVSRSPRHKVVKPTELFVRLVVVARKAGVMAIVVAGGEVRAGDAIAIELPPPPLVPLRPV